MPPPALPFFIGQSVTAREEPTRWSTPLLALKPRDKHTFTQPPATSALFLPPEGLVSVSARPLADAAWSAVDFQGHFQRVSRPTTVTLAPIATADVSGLLSALETKYGLPLPPLELSRDALRRARRGRFVSVTGTYAPGHFEGPNFGDMRLEVPEALKGTLVSGRMIRVTGFWQPATAPDPSMPRRGYAGSSIATLAISEPFYSYVYTSSRGERFEAYLGGDAPDGAMGEHGTVFRCLGSNRNLAMLLQGSGAQGTGNVALDVVQHVVRTSYEPPDESAELYNPHPTTADQLAGWIEQSVDRSALPTDGAALLDALAGRMSLPILALNDTGYAFAPDGVLACIDEQHASILRYGCARVYLVRAGIVYLLLSEDTLKRKMGEQAASALPIEMQFAPVSMFGRKSDDLPPPMHLDVYPGDRLIFLTGQAIAHRSASAIEASLLEPDLAGVVRRIHEAGAPIPRDKWAVAIFSIPFS